MAATEGAPAPRITRIKIKLGGTVLATQTIRTSGLPASSPSQGSKETTTTGKPGSLGHARACQAALREYVPPTASPDTVVARLREGEGFEPGAELQPWSFPAVSQLTVRSREPQPDVDRPAKRLKAVGSGCVATERPTAAASARPPLASRGPSAAAGASPVAAKLPPEQALKHVQQQSLGGFSSDVVESHSDQATNSQVYAPTSPDAEHCEGQQRQQAAARSGEQSAAAGPSGRPPQLAPVAQPHATACSAPGAPAALRRAPVAVGPSIGTQTQRQEFPVLPTSFLELQTLSGVAQSYTSVGPFDLQLEPAPVRLASEQAVNAHMQNATQTKREGDALRSKNGGAWSIKALSRYVSAALLFMEAADMMMQQQHQRTRWSERAADMYRQTADLLGHTSKFTEDIRGANGVGREALRLLAERLAAACYMRQASCLSAKYSSCASKALAAVRDHQAKHAGVPGRPQPSPEDSTTSGLHPAGAPQHSHPHQAAGGAGAGAAAGAAPPHLLGQEQMVELLTAARAATRFSDFMRRSTQGFEAFLERAEVRQNQQAKLVCVHLAALCMDMGMTPGMRIIQHAREAVRTLCDDLAR